MEEGGEETATDKEGMEVDTAEDMEEGSGEAWEEDMEEEERCEVVQEEDAVERPTRHSHLGLKIILLLKNENHLSKGCREANPQFSGFRLFFKEHSYFKV